MRLEELLLLLLGAAIILGGIFLSESIDSGSGWIAPSRLEKCRMEHPDWHESVCIGLAERRYGESDVLSNPSWDWETIGRGQIRIGMTAAMVEAAWGSPDYVNSSGFLGSDEDWACGGHLLQFEDQVLSEIADAQVWSVYNILSVAADNAVDYENRTQGESVFIVGHIAGIDSDFSGFPRIRFEHPDYWDEVNCLFSPVFRDEIAALRKGQRVVVLGIGDGIDFLGPAFVSCRIFSAAR